MKILKEYPRIVQISAYITTGALIIGIVIGIIIGKII